MLCFPLTADVDTPGVRPSGDSISNIPQILEGWHHRSLSAQVDASTDAFPKHRKAATSSGGLGGQGGSGGGLGHHQRARSFIQKPDGSISAMSKYDVTDVKSYLLCIQLILMKLYLLRRSTFGDGST